MSNDLKTTITELPESRVRLEVEVPPERVEDRVEYKARELGRKLKLPGFRKGKVPAALVIQRLGREAVLEEALRDSLSSWYADAIGATDVVPIGDPEIDFGELPARGETLQFSIEIGVLPKAELGDYKGLEVGRSEPQVKDEQIEEEIGKLRERLAKLESVQRPAEQGDFVVVDYAGSIDGELFSGGEGRDQLVELGSGNLIPGFEEGLIGAAAGDERIVEVVFPADYANKELAGQPASFAINVKEVKRKELPELDEDFAIDAGFDTVEELREDIRGRLLEVEQGRVESEFREVALDAAVSQAQLQIPAALVHDRAKEMFERTVHSLSHQGISREVYLQITGHSEDEVLAELGSDAERALRREAVITAVVAAEEIDPSDEELIEAITPTAEREGIAPEKLLADLRERERLEEVREDLAARQAVDLIASETKPIALEQAQAREKLWTPEKAKETEQATGAGKLWTPDS